MGVLQQLLFRFMARRERTRIIKGKEQWKKLSFNFSESLKIRGIYMLAP